MEISRDNRSFIVRGEMYNNALNYSTDLKSHMLKNSEWGAVAYLTHSKYGRNGTEIIINNNSKYLTGNAGDSISASESTKTYEYNTTQGMLASSTGNIYGIYDLSGGAFEYVASYYGESTSTKLTNNGGKMINENRLSNKYSTVYGSLGIIGDATGETNGWNDDVGGYLYSDNPFFLRGGRYNSGIYGGIFCFSNYGGDNYVDNGFRISLVV